MAEGDPAPGAQLHRAEVCRELAKQLDLAADLVDQLELSGWVRHFRRDAALLRLRAENEENPPELDG